MTLLLFARYLLLASLATVAAAHVWLMAKERKS